MNEQDVTLLQLPVFNLKEGEKSHDLLGNSVLNKITYTTAFEGCSGATPDKEEVPQTKSDGWHRAVAGHV